MRRVRFLLIFFVAAPFQLWWQISSVVAAAPLGNYLELNGGYVETTTNSSFIPEVVTIESWIKPKSTSGTQTFLWIGNAENKDPHYELGINGGSLALSLVYATKSQIIITTGSINPNVWSHVAVVVSNTTTKLYINGSSSRSFPGASHLASLGKTIIVGRSFTQNNQKSFIGGIDELRVSKGLRDISTSWATGVYNFPLSPDTDTSILWHFDETRGQKIALDSSLNGYNGTLTGEDSSVHFFGVLPSPTPFVVPSIRWLRPVFPTLSLPDSRLPSLAPTFPDTGSLVPTPSFGSNLRPPRPSRPAFR